MIKASVNTAADVARAREGLGTVRDAVDPQKGLPALMELGILQLERYASADIEVDTGRTKNSLFHRVDARQNSVVAVLGTNVRYAPYVRNASHQRQFLVNTREVEVPTVLEMIGQEIDATVEGAF